MKAFRATLFFRESESCSKILNDKMYIQYSEIRATLFFRARASCSKILNDKKYIFNTVKNCRATLFFRASASWSKILNDKKYIFNTVIVFRATLFFRVSASCKKILNSKKYIQYSEKFQRKLCFQGKRKLLKILNVKSTVYSLLWKFSGQLCFFKGKRKLLKNRELWKNFQYSVYSLGGDPCHLG